MSKSQQLITIKTNSINGEAVQTINTRDLHEFLKVGKDFTTWIKDVSANIALLKIRTT